MRKPNNHLMPVTRKKPSKGDWIEWKVQSSPKYHIKRNNNKKSLCKVSTQNILKLNSCIPKSILTMRTIEFFELQNIFFNNSVSVERNIACLPTDKTRVSNNHENKKSYFEEGEKRWQVNVRSKNVKVDCVTIPWTFAALAFNFSAEWKNNWL